MNVNKKGKFCDPILVGRFEIFNTITSFSFIICALIYTIYTKNKVRSIPFLISSLCLSLSTFFCQGFLPNNLFWTEMVSFCLLLGVLCSTYFIKFKNI